MALTKTSLLAEIDTLFAARSTEQSRGTLGTDINLYEVRGILLRLDNVAEEHNINFLVYKEGLGPEAAYYHGDPLNTVFQRKVLDNINVTRGWIGVVQTAKKPLAICRVIKTAVGGEEWVLIEETAPDTFSTTDITGTVIS